MKFLKQEYGLILLRISVALVFVWFGVSQIYTPYNWIGFIPPFISSLISAQTVVMINGSLEIILGLMMIFGIYLRFAALVLGVHVIGIALSLGYTAVTVRDLGLGFASISVFFIGPDRLCYGYIKREKIAVESL
ncbi:DoxX family membrane protein [Candidatus Woesearchaeota archaeon]|nr:DoxX family membrane protein [Candidatus Woesearchaeota archaeon]